MCSGAQADNPPRAPNGWAWAHRQAPVSPTSHFPASEEGYQRGKNLDCQLPGTGLYLGWKYQKASRFPSSSPLYSLPPKEDRQAKTGKARRSSGLEVGFHREGSRGPGVGETSGRGPGGWKQSLSPTSASRAGVGGSGTACPRAGAPRWGAGSAPRTPGKRSYGPGRCGIGASRPRLAPRRPPEEVVTRRWQLSGPRPPPRLPSPSAAPTGGAEEPPPRLPVL